MSMRKRFSVYPRYTPGSPAGVNEETARHVAAQEIEAHERYLTGVYGQDKVTFAQKQGLVGIAEQLVERAKGWDVLDLCTGEQYFRSFKLNEVRRVSGCDGVDYYTSPSGTRLCPKCQEPPSAHRPMKGNQ